MNEEEALIEKCPCAGAATVLICDQQVAPKDAIQNAEEPNPKPVARIRVEVVMISLCVFTARKPSPIWIRVALILAAYLVYSIVWGLLSGVLAIAWGARPDGPIPRHFSDLASVVVAFPLVALAMRRSRLFTQVVEP